MTAARNDPEKKPIMERNFAFVIPVWIRSEEKFIKFGRYTRWLEWREHLERYRTVWTERGWYPKDSPPPGMMSVEINKKGSSLHIKLNTDPSQVKH